MARRIAVLLAVVALVGSARAQAQAIGPGPGIAEVTIVPGGGTYFTDGKDTAEPSFGSYGLGGAFTVNLNQFIGIEGEITGTLGISQDVDFADLTSDVKPPNMLNYTGNVVFSVPNQSSVVPYVTGGVGGLSVFERAELGINGTETFFTGNVGGGIKWYAGRWGLRGDYRFVTVRSKDDAPLFFGQETRYGHRVYGAVILNIGG